MPLSRPLLVHTALTRLVDTNGVHTPHYGDYTIKIQHIALLRYLTYILRVQPLAEANRIVK